MTCLDNFIRAGDSEPLLIAAIISALLDLTELEGAEVPVSVMAQDFLNTYKYGWKTSYYQNTYDIKTDEPVTQEQKKSIEDLLNDIFQTEEEDCDSCKI